MAVQIASLNVDGLQDPKKRTSLFKFFQKSPCDVILLQETHVQDGNIAEWRREWRELTGSGYSDWNAGPSSSSCGVGILINSRKNIIVTDYAKDSDGRVLNTKISYNGAKAQILAIYGPNVSNRRERFFNDLGNIIFDTIPLIMCGDFNMVENPTLDRRGGTISTTQTVGLNSLGTIKSTYGLVDPWRKAHPGLKEYTWKSRWVSTPIESRIDRFYTSKKFKTTNYEFLSTPWSDHKIIKLDLVLGDPHNRGTNYWKLNTSVLEDEVYVTQMTDFLNTYKTKQNHFPTLSLWWEATKIEVAAFTRAYCTQVANQRRSQIAATKKQINLEASKPKPNKTHISSLYDKLSNLNQIHHSGVMIRSREQLIANEDKPTKFFYLQEQIKQTKKSIKSLKTQDDNGQIKVTTETAAIQHQIREYYIDLFKKHPTEVEAQNEILQHTIKTLTREQKEYLDAPLTEPEILNAIEYTETNKSPGIDGIPVEFYQKFWPILKDDFVTMANHIYIHQQPLSTTQKTGVIVLIYKRDDKEDLGNWRPITLLCLDYKIITKTIATRLKRILPDLIHDDQTCAVPDRIIFSNLYTIRDAITYSQHKKQNLFIVSYDFEKAFDSVDHDYYYKVLHHMNFGSTYINFFKNIYADRTSMVMNDGRLTGRIPLKRGFLQGDSLSLPSFVIVAETASNHIRAQPTITGLDIPGHDGQLKLQDYADDKESLTNEPSSITHTVECLNLFGRASGCRLNPSKIKGLMVLNQETKSQQQIIQQQFPYIAWNEDTGLKVLGIHFFEDHNNTLNYNWTKVVNKLRQMTNLLQHRTMSMRGKVILLNTIILSKVWYLASVIPLPAAHLKTIEGIILDFLWGDTRYRPISPKTFYLPISKGGLGLLHPKHQSAALRLKYFFYITDPNRTELWILYARYWLSFRLKKYNNRDWDFLLKTRCAKYNGTLPPRDDDDIDDDGNVSYYDSLGPKFPSYYRTILADHLDHYYDDLLNTPYNSTKNIYKVLIQAAYRQYSVTAEHVWNRTLKFQIPWAKVWPHNFSSYAVGKCQDVLYKLMHNAHSTKVKRHRTNNSDKYCKICKQNNKQIAEDTLHIFARCPVARAIWKAYQSIYQKLLSGRPYIYEQAALTLNLIYHNIPPPTKKLALTLTTFIVNELWQTRCSHIHESTDPCIARSVQKINTQITTTLTAHFNKHKRHHTLDTFSRLFTIDNAICQMRDGKLQFNLPIP